VQASTLPEVATSSLENAAIALAVSEEPRVDPDAIRDTLDALAAPIRIPPDAELVPRVARVAQHLFHELGFRGDEDDYDHPHNSRLDRVLERRRGLPILLSIVTIAVGDRAGLELEPVGFPGHFLVAPVGAEPRFFVDPFHSGAVITEAQLRASLARHAGSVDDTAFARAVAPVTTHEVLVRMCNNLAMSYLRREDRAGAERMYGHLVALDGPEGRVVELLRRFVEG